MAAFERVRHQPHGALLRCRDAERDLLLTPQAVRAVLVGLRSGRVSRDQARAWASFVRCGYAGRWTYPDPGVARAEAVPDNAVLPVRPLDIDFDPAAEDAIAEALAEDLFGHLTDAEIGALLQQLPERGRLT